MTYIIAEPCIDIKDRSCVDVCPVDCIHEFGRMLIIDPEECIDCGACEPECPVEAIFPEDALPDKWEAFVKINYAFPEGAGVVDPLVQQYADENNVQNEPINYSCSRSRDPLPRNRASRGKSQPRGGGRHDEADRVQRTVAAGLERAVELGGTLGEAVDHRLAPLRRSVVGDDELDAARRRALEPHRDGRRRAAADGLVERFANHLEEARARAFAELGVGDGDLDRSAPPTRGAAGDLADRGRQADLAQGHGLEPGNDPAELLGGIARDRERPRRDALARLDVAVVESGDSGVEHLRERGDVLHRPVVELLGDAPSLRTLRKETLGDEMVAAQKP